MNEVTLVGADKRKPWGLRWRSSVWFTTLVVGSGISIDLLVYSIIIPVIPFQLEDLGYSGVSGLVGWLLFAFASGLVIFTPPIAFLTEHYGSRRIPLLLGQVALIGAQIMLMEAPTYWVMVLARILQGISSAVIWTVGLALMCDVVPEQIIGRQMGFAMIGLSLGSLVGPPISGVLFQAFGFRAPFIFGIICTFIDFIGRLLIIEPSDSVEQGKNAGIMADNGVSRQIVFVEEKPDETNTAQQEVDESQVDTMNSTGPNPTRLHWSGIISKLLRSPRVISACMITLFDGLVIGASEPTLPLRLQDVWNFDPSKTGLVYIASIVPTIVSSTLAGWAADRIGTAWVAILCLVLSVPWPVLMILRSSIALFIFSYAMTCFFVVALLSPVVTELSSVSRNFEGVGYGHTYGLFNLAYGLGNALGPVVGGQLYDHVKQGWTAICLLIVGLVIFVAALAFFYFGEKPACYIFLHFRTTRVEETTDINDTSTSTTTA